VSTYTGGISEHLERSVALLEEHEATLREALARVHALEPPDVPVLLCSHDEFQRLVPQEQARQRIEGIADLDPELAHLGPNDSTRRDAVERTLETHLLGVAMTWPGDEGYADIPRGATVVVIDVDAIADAADRHSSHYEAALFQTWLHEQCHVASGDLDGDAPHSARGAWMGEVQAQGDTYLAVDHLYAIQASLVPVARRTHRYMGQLATQQLPPYRAFSRQPFTHTPQELGSDDCPDRLLYLSYSDQYLDGQPQLVEFETDLAIPQLGVGDGLYIGDRWTLGGPFVVISAVSAQLPTERLQPHRFHHRVRVVPRPDFVTRENLTDAELIAAVLDPRIRSLFRGLYAVDAARWPK
jgi:hypothetical protein